MRRPLFAVLVIFRGQYQTADIDDEESMRDSCRQTLCRDGNTVRVAADGSTGLSMIETESFDLIILDLKMPGLSGMEVLKKIKRDDHEAVVVVITGYTTVESAVEAMRGGAYDFVPKPFTPEGLRAIVRRALEKRELALENVLLRNQLKVDFGPGVVVGQSESIKKVEELIQKVGPDAHFNQALRRRKAHFTSLFHHV